MSVLFPFAAALVALRLAGMLTRRRQFAWAGGLLAYGAAAGALAWGAAHGWDEWSFRIYFLAGGLLTAALLGVGSMLLVGKRWAAPVGLIWLGFATGLAIIAPIHGTFSTDIPSAPDHLGALPRVAAVIGNSLGTVAVVGVALATLRRRPLGNALILAGIGLAAIGSAFSSIGSAATGVLVLMAICLLYAGVVAGPRENPVAANPSTSPANGR